VFFKKIQVSYKNITGNACIFTTSAKYIVLFKWPVCFVLGRWKCVVPENIHTTLWRVTGNSEGERVLKSQNL